MTSTSSLQPVTSRAGWARLWPTPTLTHVRRASASDTTHSSTGLGCPCTSDADCAGFAADYCVLPDPADPLMRRACLLQGCDMPEQGCPQTMQCCAFPFAPAGSICLPENVTCPLD